MSVKQASLQMSLQFLSELFLFLFFPIALQGVVLTDLTASTFHIFYGRSFSQRNTLIFMALSGLF